MPHAKHGHAVNGRRTKTYDTWARMHQRCSNPNNPAFERYGGRGITVCARWRKFENFLSDMGERPDGRTIDRIDNDGNYDPSNCRWATPKEQAQNRRPKRRLKPLATHCKRGHEFSPDNTRINRRGERVCKSCDALRSLNYYHRKKGALQS